MTTTTNLTDKQRRILAAIEAGQTTLRGIAAHAGIPAHTDVKYNLEQLAKSEHVLLRKTRSGIVVATGRDWCAAWDSVCRLMGNPDA